MQSKENLTPCKHENAYYNVVSRTLKFWVCPSCKQELPPPIPAAAKPTQTAMQKPISMLNYNPDDYFAHYHKNIAGL